MAVLGVPHAAGGMAGGVSGVSDARAAWCGVRAAGGHVGTGTGIITRAA